MIADTTIVLRDVPILDREGYEYGLANETSVDLVFDGDEITVVGVRFDTGWARPCVVVPTDELPTYETMLRKQFQATLEDALIDWLHSAGDRIADSRNRAMREAV